MRRLYQLDLGILSAAVVITLLGITMVYSAAYHSESGVLQSAWERQLLSAIVAVVVSVGMIYVPNRFIYGLAYPLYLGCLVSLVLVLVWGTGEDATRWLDLGVTTVQPSEFAKVIVILTLARYLSDRRGDQLNRFPDLAGALLIPLIPTILVIRQPDLGTAMVFSGIFLPMLYWAGMSPVAIFLLVSPVLSTVFSFEPLWRGAAPFVFAAFIIISTGAIHYLLSRLWVTIGMVSANLAAGLVSVYLWEHLLRPYQQDRILTFLDPEKDRLGTGWNIIQSKIAIGSGGLTGKGFLQGTQTKFEFLPAAHTDFIFAVIGEELGFVGTMVVLALFLYLVTRGIQVAAAAENRFYSLVALGLAAMFVFHVFVNAGMTMGVMPVTGVPLPFLTYGGSSLITNFAAVGLILHVHLHRHEL